ncbi:MAG: monovalent cation/H+ antiporter complex subunit F [Bacteroidota bacterium]
MTIIYIIVFTLMAIGMIFSMIRFVKGPRTGDRAMALDTLSIIITAAMVLLAHVFERYIYVDVALIYAVLGFVGVIVIARYIEGAL